MKRFLSIFLSIALLATMLAGLNINVWADDEDNVVSIRFEPRFDYEIIEETNGYWDTREEWDDEEEDYIEVDYYVYNLPPFYDGDALYVRYNDGRGTVLYNYDEDEYAFVASNGKEIYPFFTSEQYDEPWTLGENTFYIRYGDASQALSITIVENPVDLFYFEPAGSYEIIENTNGEWQARWDEDEEDYVEYFEYNLPNFQNGDTLHVEYNDGRGIVEYVYDEDEGCFISEDGERAEAEMSSYQSEVPWELGEGNRFVVEFCGKVDVVSSVTILGNTVDYIAFYPVKDYELIEETNGYWDTRWDEDEEDYVKYYYYDLPSYNKGDTLKVQYNDGRGTVEYVYDDEEGLFVSEDCEGIELQRDSYQYDNPWTVGEGNSFFVTYFGHSDVVNNVTIIENPVSWISFEPYAEYEIFEETEGEWRTRQVWDEDEEDYYDEEYYHYDIPYFTNGDTLTVKYNDGRGTVKYSYRQRKGGFYSNKGEKIEVVTDSWQSEDPWTVEDGGVFSVEYCGRQDAVSVKIVENPVASVSFTPAKSVDIIEGINGEWDTRWEWDDDEEDYIEVDFFCYNIPDFSDGDSLTVEYKDERGTVEYIYDDNCGNFVSEDGDMIDANIASYQYDNPWTLGDNNTYGVGYMGCYDTAYVSIVENTIERIEYIPNVSRIIEHTNGDWNYDNEDNKYFYYDIGAKKGDKLVFYFEDDEPLTYTIKNVRGELVYKSDKGDTMPAYYPFDYNDQHVNHWKLGNNTIECNYFGYKCNVNYEIIETPVESLTINNVDHLKFAENGYGNWQKFEKYDYKFGILYDSSVTVNFKDGSTNTYYYDKYSFEYVSKDGNVINFENWDIFADDTAKDWKIGTDNYLVFSALGFETEIPVEIVKNPINSIEVEEIESMDGKLSECQVYPLSNLKLKLNYANGTSTVKYLKNYPIQRGYDSSYAVFIDGFPVEFSFEGCAVSEQGENEFTINYCGKSDSFYVDCDDYVESANLKRVASNKYGEGAEIELVYSDGTSETIKLEEVVEYHGFDTIIKTEDGSYFKISNMHDEVTDWGYGGDLPVDFDTNKASLIFFNTAGKVHAVVYLIDHEHSCIEDILKAPTCTEEGSAKYTCTICDKEYIGTLNANGHTVVTDYGYPATCLAPGLSNGAHCSVCDTLLTAQTPIAPTGHTVVTDYGYPATCTSQGLTNGSHCSVCNTVFTAQTAIPAKGHNVVTDYGYPSTCTAAGLTDGTHCSICNAVISAQYAIPAKGHNVVTDYGYSATYTATGLTNGSHCSVCGTVIEAQTEIAKLEKNANTLKVSAKTAKLKIADVKKKNKTLAVKKVLGISKAKGTVTYEKKSGNKSITVNKKTGKVTVKKGLKKGIYKIKVKVSAAGTDEYKAGSKTVTFKVVIN